MAAFYIADQENIDNENNMALKLNAHVARCLHGKKIEYKVDGSDYDDVSNPLNAFQNHFNMSRSFTGDFIGEKLWE